ncbi:hypothetical protein EGW08_013458 [Elysia chlorotica]|uniref:VWFA domain-containing protein n=1 Tax=Elysia chlorotica TaxID=188477 RepID=A0A433TBF7_ELYCH|nr:hypothetical protein EGW08_013458 [Elysia chlorotica]
MLVLVEPQCPASGVSGQSGVSVVEAYSSGTVRAVVSMVWMCVELECFTDYQVQERQSCHGKLHAEYRVDPPQTSKSIKTNSPLGPDHSEAPVYGQWSDWTEWSQCTRTCGGGIQFRNRACTSTNDVEACRGVYADAKSCNEDPCDQQNSLHADQVEQSQSSHDNLHSKYGNAPQLSSTSVKSASPLRSDYSEAYKADQGTPSPDISEHSGNIPPKQDSDHNAQVCTSGDRADIFILLDASSSLKLRNFRTTLSFSKDIVEAFNIGPDRVRVGLATFSNLIRNVIKLDRYTDKPSLLTAIDKIRYTGGTTLTHTALRAARTKFFTGQNGARDSAPHFLILVTDGQSTYPQKTKIEAALLAQENITALTIGVGSSVNEKELKLIASSPSLVFHVKNFQQLSTIKADVARLICQGNATARIRTRDLLRRKPMFYPWTTARQKVA